MPLNFHAFPSDTADFVVSSSWSDKVFKEAKKFSAAWSSKDSKYTSLSLFDAIKQNLEARFLHICSNETIHIVKFKDYLEPHNKLGILITDMSSNFLMHTQLSTVVILANALLVVFCMDGQHATWGESYLGGSDEVTSAEQRFQRTDNT
ncbi:hypothetical protein E2562_017772 [Oryza meyeriana var. granulata]|uniref:Uncharacterized protein n=1 Tax=Oryza meyeriana var. granulata TaxID=110450 RepID=A0A6G1BLI0_9ORYZ|nr:hypothetical protein E2562_017772 [Oryza meyeriana var. granulata]